MDEERQELQTLVSDISHQVKTPVSNLKMATDTLLEKPMTEAERIDFIRGIRRYKKGKYQYEVLTNDKNTFKKKYGITSIDKPSIDDIMLFYIKGER